MPMPISLEDAQKEYGISYSYEIMDNGERRFRLHGPDKSSYIRTETFQDGWQNSHHHKCLKEVYVVENGWMILAILDRDSLSLSRFPPGSVATINPNVIHNIFLPEFTVIHTIKVNPLIDKDWFASEALDQLTHKINKVELVKIPFYDLKMNFGVENEK